jgi:hypothetical protein
MAYSGKAAGLDLAGFAAQDGQDVVAVNLEAARHVEAERGEQRREPISEVDHVVDDASAGQADPGPTNDAGHADAAFIDDAFRAVEIAVEPRSALIALAAELRAVVAGEHQDGVLLQT